MQDREGRIFRSALARAPTISPVLPSVLRTRFFFLAAPRRRLTREWFARPVFRGSTQKEKRSRDMRRTEGLLS